MTGSFDPTSRALPLRHIIGRGLTAAHAALLGALYLFLLQAPVQILSALTYPFQRKMMPAPGQPVDPGEALLALVWGLGSFVLALAVFFLFPLVLGGILGQVRDRIEFPHKPAGAFGTYARTHYTRLLGSQGLYVLIGLATMLPVMILSMVWAFQELAKGASLEGPPLNPQVLSQPGVLVAMGIAALLMAALSLVYWVANSIVVAEGERVVASWRKAIRFCQHNCVAVLVIWLVAVGLGVIMVPLSLAGQLGWVNDPWLLAAMAVVYAAFISYWCVILAGLIMSLYLGRAVPTEQREPVQSVQA
jgi:hypothetical protein